MVPCSRVRREGPERFAEEFAGPGAVFRRPQGLPGVIRGLFQQADCVGSSALVGKCARLAFQDPGKPEVTNVTVALGAMQWLHTALCAIAGLRGETQVPVLSLDVADQEQLLDELCRVAAVPRMRCGELLTEAGGFLVEGQSSAHIASVHMNLSEVFQAHAEISLVLVDAAGTLQDRPPQPHRFLERRAHQIVLPGLVMDHPLEVPRVGQLDQVDKITRLRLEQPITDIDVFLDGGEGIMLLPSVNSAQARSHRARPRSLW